MTTGALSRLRDSLPQVFAGEPIPGTEIPDIAAMTAGGADFAVYEGSYELRPGRNLGIRSAGTHLDVDGWMLLPLRPGEFFCVQDFGRVVFERSEDGSMTGLRWGDSEHYMARVGEVD